MGFSDKSVKSLEKCFICMNPAWIKIEIIEDKERIEKFVCVIHYVEFLEHYLSNELESSKILFPKQSKMLEIPLYEAMERFGGLNEKSMLEQYTTYLDEKIQKINEELSQSSDHFFVTLLQNEKQDKILRKLLAQSRIKNYEL